MLETKTPDLLSLIRHFENEKLSLTKSLEGLRNAFVLAELNLSRVDEALQKLGEVKTILDRDPLQMFDDRTEANLSRATRPALDPAPKKRRNDRSTEPYFLNVMNGQVDLKTGDLISKPDMDIADLVCCASYDEEADRCSLWLSTLGRIFNNDPDAIAYLQRAAGYSILGAPSERVIFMLVGEGHGKSLIINVLRSVLGDYAIEFDAWRTSSDDPTLYRASLNGRRFVVSEPPATNRLTESFIKSSTGGDLITARHLYGESFVFSPQFVMWMHTNEQLTFQGQESLYRRMRFIHFDNIIPEEDQDGTLFLRLIEERDGILQWLLAGSQAYQAEGFDTLKSLRSQAESFPAPGGIQSQVESVADYLTEAKAPGETFDDFRARIDRMAEPPASFAPTKKPLSRSEMLKLAKHQPPGPKPASNGPKAQNNNSLGQRPKETTDAPKPQPPPVATVGAVIPTPEVAPVVEPAPIAEPTPEPTPAPKATTMPPLPEMPIQNYQGILVNFPRLTQDERRKFNFAIRAIWREVTQSDPTAVNDAMEALGCTTSALGRFRMDHGRKFIELAKCRSNSEVAAFLQDWHTELEKGK